MKLLSFDNIQVAFGTLLFVYFPNLDPYPGYAPLRTETSEDYEYEELPGGEQICPERHANLFDSRSPLPTSHFHPVDLVMYILFYFIVRITTESLISALYLLPIGSILYNSRFFNFDY